MTEVAFHFNVPDKMNYVCRLLRKATLAKARVVVAGPQQALQTLDEALWTLLWRIAGPRTPVPRPISARSSSRTKTIPTMTL